MASFHHTSLDPVLQQENDLYDQMRMDWIDATYYQPPDPFFVFIFAFISVVLGGYLLLR